MWEGAHSQLSGVTSTEPYDHETPKQWERTALWEVFVSTHILSTMWMRWFLPWKANKGPGFLPPHRENYSSDNKNFLFLIWRQTSAFLGCGLHMLGFQSCPCIPLHWQTIWLAKSTYSSQEGSLLYLAKLQEEPGQAGSFWSQLMEDLTAHS